MSRIKATTVFSLFTASLPLALYVKLYPAMPPEVPIHFDMKGQADRYVSKTSGEVIFLAALGLVGWVVFKLIFYFSLRLAAGKGNLKAVQTGKILDLSALCFTLVMTGISVQALFVQAGGLEFSGTDLSRVCVGLMGVTLVAVGNRMPKLSRNSLAGLRTRETLRSDELWFKGQRAAGRAYVAGGLLMLPCCLLPGLWVLYTAVALFVLANVVPVVYVKKQAARL